MQNLNLNLTVEETNLVLTALAELPFRVSNGLIGKITESANAQLAPQPAEPTGPEA